jgi:hypothetical protein
VTPERKKFVLAKGTNKIHTTKRSEDKCLKPNKNRLQGGAIYTKQKETIEIRNERLTILLVNTYRGK